MCVTSIPPLHSFVLSNCRLAPPCICLINTWITYFSRRPIFWLVDRKMPRASARSHYKVLKPVPRLPNSTPTCYVIRSSGIEMEFLQIFPSEAQTWSLWRILISLINPNIIKIRNVKIVDLSPPFFCLAAPKAATAVTSVGPVLPIPPAPATQEGQVLSSPLISLV